MRAAIRRSAYLKKQRASVRPSVRPEFGLGRALLTHIGNIETTATVEETISAPP